MCICVEGEILAYTAMPFGMSQAVEAFSSIEEQKHRVMRLLSIKLAFMIDDRAAVAATQWRATWNEIQMLIVGTGLGCYFSFGEMTVDADGMPAYAKCVVAAVQRFAFLGIEVNIRETRLTISEKKIGYFIRYAVGMLARPGGVTPRDFARVAGLLMSFSPAMQVARLYIRAMYMTVTGRADWDRVLGSPEAALAALSFFVERVRSFNGRSWAQSRVCLSLATDASDFAGGGYQVAHTLSDGGLRHPVVVTLTAEIAAASSLVRELWVLLQALKVVFEQLGEQLGGLGILVIGDNLGAATVLEKLYAPSAWAHGLVVQIWELALRNGTQLYFKWQRRSTEEMVIADDFSKMLDHSAWQLLQSVVDRLFARCLALTGESPTLDACADHENAKCALFISRELCPGSAAVDMFSNGGLMHQHLCYINPDFSKMEDVVRVIRAYKVDCILVYPAWNRAWRTNIAGLPPIGETMELPNSSDLCTPGSRVGRPSTGAPRYPLHACVVWWGVRSTITSQWEEQEVWAAEARAGGGSARRRRRGLALTPLQRRRAASHAASPLVGGRRPQRGRGGAPAARHNPVRALVGHPPSESSGMLHLETCAGAGGGVFGCPLDVCYVYFLSYSEDDTQATVHLSNLFSHQ